MWCPRDQISQVYERRLRPVAKEPPRHRSRRATDRSWREGFALAHVFLLFPGLRGLASCIGRKWTGVDCHIFSSRRRCSDDVIDCRCDAASCASQAVLDRRDSDLPADVADGLCKPLGVSSLPQCKCRLGNLANSHRVALYTKRQAVGLAAFCLAFGEENALNAIASMTARGRQASFVMLRVASSMLCLLRVVLNVHPLTIGEYR